MFYLKVVDNFSPSRRRRHIEPFERSLVECPHPGETFTLQGQTNITICITDRITKNSINIAECRFRIWGMWASYAYNLSRSCFIINFNINVTSYFVSATVSNCFYFYSKMIFLNLKNFQKLKLLYKKM